jgi:hypothetical protein
MGTASVRVFSPEPIEDERAETPEDRGAVREVNRQSFRREDEARLVDALREGGHARLSLVAEDGGRVVGHILFSDLAIVTQAGTLNGLALELVPGALENVPGEVRYPYPSVWSRHAHEYETERGVISWGRSFEEHTECSPSPATMIS